MWGGPLVCGADPLVRGRRHRRPPLYLVDHLVTDHRGRLNNSRPSPNLMPIDPKYLREQYASLSDDALMAIDRAELVEAAQRCYDDEVARRRPARDENEPLNDGDKPDWLKDASEVFSRVDLRGTVIAPDIAAARDALEAEGIPCHLDLAELPDRKSVV